MEHYAINILLTVSLWTCLLDSLQAVDNRVTPSCSPEAKICRFKFSVHYNITMMAWDPNELGGPDSMLPVITGKDGKLYAKRKDCSGQDILSEGDYETLISGDGNHKRIMAINAQLPGTPIVVYEGQQVSVIVKNEMDNEMMTLHWHGLHMRGTPWMDGAGSVSHCPIQPRQTFEYRFLADKAGTHWYHGHIGIERTMGMAGHLTVLPRSKEEENKKRGSDKLPIFDEEFHFMVADWSDKATDEEYFMSASECVFQPERCSGDFKYVDGTLLSPFYSAIINGKGQRYEPKGNTLYRPEIPIEVFTVKKNGRYRFRIVNSGMNAAFKLSVDQHLIHVIASDGSDVTTTTVSNLVTSGGETYDVYIEATDPDKSGNYWIRAETLEYTNGETKVRPRHAEAILRYNGAPHIKPKSHPQPCSQDKKCIYLNCNSRFYPEEENIVCLPVTSLRHPLQKPTLKPTDGTGFTEYLLALQLQVLDKPATINAIQHVPHTVAPQIYPKDTGGVKCEESCSTEGCTCTHVLTLPKDHIIQLTLFSYQSETDSAVSFHPIHLHGHDFQVIKTGWPSYNSTTGELLQPSQDIDCGSDPGCHTPRWADKSWERGYLPDIITKSAPLKHTIMVPAGGYIVVRFKADNPGHWLLHCHMELHQIKGMALVFKEGEVADMPPVPRGFPVCGNFDWSSEEFSQKIHHVQPRKKLDRKTQAIVAKADESVCLQATSASLQAVTIGLGILLSVLLLALMLVLSRIFATSHIPEPEITSGLILRSSGSSSRSSQERVPLLSNDE